MILNATDTSTSRTFEFTQQTFNYLCSDIAKYPLTAAIAASAAFPFLMSPITLRNNWNDEDCRKDVNPFPPDPFPPSGFAKAFSEQGRYSNLDVFLNARYIHSLRYTYQTDFKDRSNIPYRRIEYVHLLDGGLSDNLAARSLLRAFSPAVARTLIDKNVSRILLIQVNAKSDEDRDIDHSSESPSIGEVFKTVAFNQIDVATTLSAYISKAYWVSVIRYENYKQGGTAGRRLDFYPVQIDFDQMKPYSDEQRRVKTIKTWWSIPEEQVTFVEEAGRDLLMSHPCFQAFLRDSINRDDSTQARDLIASLNVIWPPK